MTEPVLKMSGCAEEVAFKLFQSIALAEGKSVFGVGNVSFSPPTREWILKAYSECLYTVHNPSLKA